MYKVNLDKHTGYGATIAICEGTEIVALAMLSEEHSNLTVRQNAKLPANAERLKHAFILAAALDLLEACKAWMKVESEMSSNTPCPDLALRANYQRTAVNRPQRFLALGKSQNKKSS